MEFDATRITKQLTVEETREKVMNMVGHCDEQTLATLYEAAYEHVLSSCFDSATGVILYDLYEHRPLLFPVRSKPLGDLEEIDAKRATEATEEHSISEVFEEIAATTEKICGSVFQEAQKLVKEIGLRIKEIKNETPH